MERREEEGENPTLRKIRLKKAKRLGKVRRELEV